MSNVTVTVTKTFFVISIRESFFLNELMTYVVVPGKFRRSIENARFALTNMMAAAVPVRYFH
jgi:hypothetical protein